MNRAFPNNVNTKIDNPLYDRSMINFNDNPTYTQFNSNQINDSLKLLSITDNLKVSSYDELQIDKKLPLDTSISGLPIQNPTAKPISNNNFLDFSTQNTSHNNINIPSFSDFVIAREPALEIGLTGLPLKNPTFQPNQNNNHLDFSKQLEHANINKSTMPSKNIISNNDINSIDRFQGVATPYINYDEYKKPTAYFNNFVDNGKSDIIREYVVHVNSIDRDVIKYPSPFNFLVKCAPLPGDKDASINRRFDNIRYIKMETAILPVKYYLIRSDITTNNINSSPDYLPNIIQNLFNTTLPSPNTQFIENNITWVIIYAKSYNNNQQSNENSKYANTTVIVYTQLITDISTNMEVCYECTYFNITSTYTTYKYLLSNRSIGDDKYTILYLNDINDVSNYSTDKILSNAFNVLYPDLIQANSLYIDCNYVEKIYKYSNLGNIEKILINLTNSLGKQLTTNLIAQDDRLSNFDSTICTCTTDINGNIIRDYKCICTYFRHPRYDKFQFNIMFKFGLIETDMNTRAFN